MYNYLCNIFRHLPVLLSNFWNLLDFFRWIWTYLSVFRHLKKNWHSSNFFNLARHDFNRFPKNTTSQKHHITTLFVLKNIFKSDKCTFPHVTWISHMCFNHLREKMKNIYFYVPRLKRNNSEKRASEKLNNLMLLIGSFSCNSGNFQSKHNSNKLHSAEQIR